VSHQTARLRSARQAYDHVSDVYCVRLDGNESAGVSKEAFGCNCIIV